MIIGLLVLAIFVMLLVISVTLSLGFIWWQAMILGALVAIAFLMLYAVANYGIAALRRTLRPQNEPRQSRSTEKA